MSGQVSRGSAGENQADEQSGVARLSWRARDLGLLAGVAGVAGVARVEHLLRAGQALVWLLRHPWKPGGAGVTSMLASH